ncbi:MAG: gliding motility lipoprotein GldH [Cyclobacteriaceae bacterium]|jgi:gliding motility-associated lipoprotein GldH|nr:gliding motility lipoprotein GldH [Cyclobacteriaceae bacterium]
MKYFCFILVLFLCSCDSTRLFEENEDFKEGNWAASTKPSFTFNIQDNTQAYCIYSNLRYSSDYPYSRIFVHYAIADSIGNVITQQLASGFLFDAKTGKPTGNTGIGDVYDTRIILVDNFQFPYPGKFSIQLKQEMRDEILTGILAAGYRIELSSLPKP